MCTHVSVLALLKAWNQQAARLAEAESGRCTRVMVLKAVYDDLDWYRCIRTPWLERRVGVEGMTAATA